MRKLTAGCGKVAGLGATGRAGCRLSQGVGSESSSEEGKPDFRARGQTRGRGEGRARGKDFKFGDFEVRDFDAGDFGVAGGCRFNRQRDAVLDVLKEAKTPAGGVRVYAGVDFETDSLRFAKEERDAA